MALDPQLVIKKIADYGIENYQERLEEAIDKLAEVVEGKAFSDQMRRFIDAGTCAKTLDNPLFLEYLTNTVGDLFEDMKAALSPSTKTPQAFRM